MTDEALAALADGEPRRASGVLDAGGAGALEPELRTAPRWLAWTMTWGWAPGPVGAVLAIPLPEAPTAPEANDDLAATWWGEVVPQALALRSMAIGARRAGPEQAGAHFAKLARPKLLGWLARAEQSGVADLVAQVLIEAAAVARLQGQDAFAAAKLEEAERVCAAAGPDARAARSIELGDALLTPRGSPETLGEDLDDRGADPVLGDAAARAAAAAHYTAARDALVTAGEAADAGSGLVAVDLRRAVLARADGRAGDAVAALDALVAATTGAPHVLALTHRALARIATGDLASSRPGLVAEIVAWARGPGSPSYALGCAGLLHAAAWTALERGEVDAALAAFDLARRLHDELGDPVGALGVVSDRGELYERLGCVGATIATIEESYEATMATLPDGPVEPLPWMRLGLLQTRLGVQLMHERDPQPFVMLRRRIDDLLARAPLGPDAPPSGDAPLDVLEHAEAATRQLAVLATHRAGPLGGGPDWAEGERAQLRLNVGALEQARTNAEVMTHNVRALAALDRGDTETADRAFAEALAVADRPERPDPAFALFVLIGWRRPAELRRRVHDYLARHPAIAAEFEADLRLAVDEGEAAFATLERAGAVDPPPEEPRWHPQWAPCELRARIARVRGLPSEADRLGTEGTARFERWFAAISSDTFRISALDDIGVRRLHHVAGLAALDLGAPTRVLAAADRTRSLALGVLAAERSGEGPPAPAVLRARAASAAWNGAFDRRRAAWRGRDPRVLAASAAALAAAQAELDAAVGAAPQRGAPLPPTDADAVAAALDADTLLVHYTMTDDHLVVVTVTRDGVDAVRGGPDRRALVGAVARLHAEWSGRAPARPDDAGAVAEALLGPVRDRLARRPRVLVVPDGALHTLPFAALELDGEPVVARWAVSQLPSAALVPRLAGRPRPRLGRGSLVVGDPVRGRAALPGARVEAVTVARLLGVTALVGPAATETAVRTGAAGTGAVLHLATHGRLDEQAPDLSALALADDEELTVAELLGLGLDADLAVLSACDSGRGEVTQGGDVVGLARGLIAAGARHAVVSSWPVDDRVACLTMVAFTEQVVAGATVAEALARAQRAVRGLTAFERDDRYRELAVAADLDPEPAGPVRRATRDLRPPLVATSPTHPSSWAPFVHLGV